MKTRSQRLYIHIISYKPGLQLQGIVILMWQNNLKRVKHCQLYEIINLSDNILLLLFSLIVLSSLPSLQCRSQPHLGLRPSSKQRVGKHFETRDDLLYLLCVCVLSAEGTVRPRTHTKSRLYKTYHRVGSLHTKHCVLINWLKTSHEQQAGSLCRCDIKEDSHAANVVCSDVDYTSSPYIFSLYKPAESRQRKWGWIMTAERFYLYLNTLCQCRD